MGDMNAVDCIARILVIIGALNWGLSIWITGGLLASWGTVATIIYALVGLSGIWEIVRLFKH